MRLAQSVQSCDIMIFSRNRRIVINIIDQASTLYIQCCRVNSKVSMNAIQQIHMKNKHKEKRNCRTHIYDLCTSYALFAFCGNEAFAAKNKNISKPWQSTHTQTNGIEWWVGCLFDAATLVCRLCEVMNALKKQPEQKLSGRYVQSLFAAHIQPQRQRIRSLKGCGWSS